MDPNPRKHRFKPKAPQRNRKPSVAKPEDGDGDADVADTDKLIERFNDIQRLQRPKVEKKASAQVAFGPGAESSSTSIRKFGSQRARNAKDTDSVMNIAAAYNEQPISTSSFHSLMKEDGYEESSTDSINASAPSTKMEYREPWDHDSDYHPITLPLRKPNSGDPELLDEAEFGEEATKAEYDENTINAAEELGLLDSQEPKLLFLQLPKKLPFDKLSESRKGKEKVDSSALPERSEAVKKRSDLEELPAGYIGKMLVHKSGKIKMKLGEIPYDVFPGSPTVFAQNVAAINTEEKQFCIIGSLDKRAVIAPDIDSILNSVNDSELPQKKQSSESSKNKQS
ncbi:hypothetical protein SLA2020_139960 [Shorea laevis]